jgi:ABC-2 type transport system ATP-binding protein
LCPRMAIISQGRVLLSGQPAEAMRALEGRVWRKAIAHSDMEACKSRFVVLSTRLSGGKTIIHVLADALPEEGFTAVAPDLEDVYFGQLVQQIRCAA